MKIYNWIDQFFSTRERRRNMLNLLVCIYWLWQTGTLIYFLGSLLSLNNYESLFNLLEMIENFKASLVLSTALNIIENGRFSFIILFTSISFSQWFMLLISMIAFTSSTSRKKWFIGYCLTVSIVALGLGLGLGFKAGSLMQVIIILKAMAAVLILTNLVIYSLLGWKLYKLSRFLITVCMS